VRYWQHHILGYINTSPPLHQIFFRKIITQPILYSIIKSMNRVLKNSDSSLHGISSPKSTLTSPIFEGDYKCFFLGSLLIRPVIKLLKIKLFLTQFVLVIRHGKACQDYLYCNVILVSLFFWQPKIKQPKCLSLEEDKIRSSCLLQVYIYHGSLCGNFKRKLLLFL